jgi:glucoamylase
LCIALTAPARVHWAINGWQQIRDAETRDTGLGVHVADMPVSRLAAGETVQFTFRWRQTELWEGQNYEVLVT